MPREMRTQDYNDMLHFAPQRSTESRYARNYRAQNPEQPTRARRVTKTAIVLRWLGEAVQVAFMMMLAYVIYCSLAVLT